MLVLLQALLLPCVPTVRKERMTCGYRANASHPRPFFFSFVVLSFVGRVSAGAHASTQYHPLSVSRTRAHRIERREEDEQDEKEEKHEYTKQHISTQ
ncbi:MAG: hypothetical protein BYD32DRAFT_56192 [Podila humilis]|nr:MAG: hypothetical protein BYD32DRAFT_56192 [Podila humilis]